tara:strand:+ start:4111 stop:5319 length:1209 start_codon:yes stop_codon:yes gene_type:complete
MRSKKNSAYRKRWKERLGWVKAEPTDILIHCVSLGETQIALPFIQYFLTEHPQLKLCVTCSSPAASERIQAELGNRVQHYYLPFDFYHAISSFIKRLQPRMTLIMETELWPNMLHCLLKQESAILLCNARLSEKAYLNYQKVQFLIRPFLSRIHRILVQTELEAKRFKALTYPVENTQVVGSLKYDISISESVKARAQEFRKQWENRPVWIAGSVHPEEFDAVIQAHQTILKVFPEALLIMVPRHTERFPLCIQSVKASGLSYAQRSQDETPEVEVLIGDTLGELLALYGASDVAFVGGSLTAYGGHNPIEPASFAIPALMGSSVHDFYDVCTALSQCGHLSYVEDAKTLSQQVLKYFSHPDQSAQDGKAGYRCIEERQGATAHHCDVFQQYLVQVGLISSH